MTFSHESCSMLLMKETPPPRSLPIYPGGKFPLDDLSDTICNGNSSIKPPKKNCNGLQPSPHSIISYWGCSRQASIHDGKSFLIPTGKTIVTPNGREILEYPSQRYLILLPNQWFHLDHKCFTEWVPNFLPYSVLHHRKPVWLGRVVNKSK